MYVINLEPWPRWVSILVANVPLDYANLYSIYKYLSFTPSLLFLDFWMWTWFWLFVGSGGTRPQEPPPFSWTDTRRG